MAGSLWRGPCAGVPVPESRCRGSHRNRRRATHPNTTVHTTSDTTDGSTTGTPANPDDHAAPVKASCDSCPIAAPGRATAACHHCTIEIDVSDGAARLQVVNDGALPANGANPGTGLAALSRYLGEHAGRLEAGLAPDGTFRLDAVLPGAAR